MKINNSYFTISLLLIFSLNISIYFGQNDAYHTSLFSQIQNDYGLTGGSLILTGNELTNISTYVASTISSTNLTINGQAFSNYSSVNIAQQGVPWGSQYYTQTTNSFQQGDKLLFVAWLRVASGSGNRGKLDLVVENRTTYQKELLVNVSPTSTWKQYLIPFESSANFTQNGINLSLHLGYKDQIIEVAGINIINYGNSYTLAQLPTEIYQENYPGSEANATWRSQANSRIETHRKANLNLTVTDANGVNLNGVTAHIKMKKHCYSFGTAVVPMRFANNPWHNQTYEDKLINLDGNGHGFNSAVYESALKWKEWENGWAGSAAQIVNATQWLANNDITVRGHVLVWPGGNLVPPDVANNLSNIPYVKNRMNGWMDSILNLQGIRGTIKEWDVLNELVHVRGMEYAFAGQPGYLTGREIYPEIFNTAKMEDPSIISYINDYNLLSIGSKFSQDYVQFKNFTQEIISAGATIDGIGMQSHMGGNLIHPDSIYDIIEDCYQQFNVPIKITEYDQDAVIDDSVAATYTKDFMTMVFSHPATNGFIMWGFWDGAHWKNNSPLYYNDWTPKPLHGVYTNLLFNEWWTDTTVSTNQLGNNLIRGFKGDYDLILTYGGVTDTFSISMCSDLDTTLSLSINCPQSGTSCNDGNTLTINDVEDGNCNCSGTLIQGPNDIYLEAECPNVTGSYWTEIMDNSVSNNKYLMAQSAFYNTGSALGNGTAAQLVISYSFNSSVGGNFYLNSRTLTPDGGANSLWFRINGGNWIYWDMAISQNFNWKQYGLINLNSGANSIDFSIREGDLLLDKIAIISPQTLPTNFGWPANNCSSPCIPSSSSYIESSCNSFTWAVNGLSYSNSGIYIDTSINGNGCTHTDSLILSISNSSSSSNSVTVCKAYTWPINNITYNQSGSFEFISTNSNGCEHIDSLYLTINQIDNTVTATNSILTSNNLSASYQWLECSSYSYLAGQSNRSFSPALDGIYAVEVTEGNCVDTSSCFAVYGVGINELNNNPSVFYPNPANEEIALRINNFKESSKLKIYDSYGKLVLTKDLKESINKINLEFYKSGVYIFRVSNSENDNYYKVIINH